MNLRQKLNETNFAEKVNNGDFGIVVEALSELVEDKEASFAEKTVIVGLYPIWLAVGYGMAKKIKREVKPLIK